MTARRSESFPRPRGFQISWVLVPLRLGGTTLVPQPHLETAPKFSGLRASLRNKSSSNGNAGRREASRKHPNPMVLLRPPKGSRSTAASRSTYVLPLTPTKRNPKLHQHSRARPSFPDPTQVQVLLCAWRVVSSLELLPLTNRL